MLYLGLLYRLYNFLSLLIATQHVLTHIVLTDTNIYMHLYLIIINTQPSNLRIWGHIMYKERHTFFEQHFMRMYIMIVMIEKTK